LFNSSAQVSGSAGTTATLPLTQNFGPDELSNEIDLYNLFPFDGNPGFRRWYFDGPNLVSSPYVFGYLG
jgi:hypothetical protein